MVLVNLEKKAKHFPIILLRLQILAISIIEVAVHKGFFWKVLICELLKDKFNITSWSRDNGLYIPNCDSLPCHAMHFLAL